MSFFKFNVSDNPLQPPQAVQVSSAPKFAANRAAWNRLRPVIKRLYVDEDKKLKEVMEIMEREHGHRATVKMYKTYITKWQLDKKTKESEAWEILRTKIQRDAVGKDSMFRVRGKTVTIDDVLRYFKRKGIVNPDVQQHPRRSSTLLAIECWTPFSSPKPGQSTLTASGASMAQEGVNTDVDVISGVESTQDQHGYATNYLNVEQTRELLSSSPVIQSFEIPSSPLPPQIFLSAEKLFASIRAYYEGTCSDGFFKPIQNGYRVMANVPKSVNFLNEFFQLCLTGAQLMRSNSFHEGRRCFSKASGLIPFLLRSQPERLLDYYLRIIRHLIRFGYQEIANTLLELTSGFAALVFTEKHPWIHVFSEIRNLVKYQFESPITEAWRCMSDTLSKSLGQFHYTALSCHMYFALENYDEGDTINFFQRLLSRGGEELDKSDKRLLEIKAYYGEALTCQGKYKEATRVLEEVVASCQANGVRLASTKVGALEAIAQCCYHLGQRQKAEAARRQCIEIGEFMFGKSSSYVLGVKTRYVECLRKWGREDDAAILQAEVDEILPVDDMD